MHACMHERAHTHTHTERNQRQLDPRSTLTIRIFLQLQVAMETEGEDVHVTQVSKVLPSQLVVGQHQGAQGKKSWQPIHTPQLQK